MSLTMGCKLAEKWWLRTEEGQDGIKDPPPCVQTLLTVLKLRFIPVQEVTLAWMELHQLFNCCHFPSCRWCVTLQRQENSKMCWNSHLQSPKDSDFAVSAGTQHLWRGPTGSTWNDARTRKDCWHLPPTVERTSSFGYQRGKKKKKKSLGVHARKRWNVWKAILKEWQSNRWEPQDGNQPSPEQKEVRVPANI